MSGDLQAPKPARRRWHRRAWKPLLGTYVVYLLAIHLFINLPLLASLIAQPNSVTITWDWAVTPFPGWAFAHGFYLTVEDDNIQLGLRIDDVGFWFDPVDIFHKTFHVTSCNGSGISFRIRAKRDPEEAAAAPERIAALPPIAGFPDAIRRRPRSLPDTVAPTGMVTVHIEDAHALIRELWIEGLRYDGEANAYGNFTIQPMIHANVDGHLRVSNGDLTYGEQRVASALIGSGSFVLDDFSIFDESGLQPLRHMHSQLAIDGELQNARFLNAVLRRTPAPGFASSPGRFELFGKFEAGRIAPGSTFRLRASDWQLSKGVYRSSGNYAQLEASTDGPPPTTGLTAAVSLGSYEVDNPTLERELIEGEGLIVRLSSHRLDLLDLPLDDLGFEVNLDQARMPDLRIVNDFLPPSKLWEVLSGSGSLSGAFVSPPTGAGHGDFHLAAHGAALRFRRLRFAGELRVDGQLSGVASNSKDIGLLGRDEMEGHGRLSGHITASNLADVQPSDRPLATFDAAADVVLHPLLATEIKGADVLHHLSGELKVDGKVPGLEFLNGALESRGIQLGGGAGSVALDMRLTHGILGRASELRFTSRAISVAAASLHAKADLEVAALVSQIGDTAQVAVDARVKSLVAGPDDLPELVKLSSIQLRAQSPEVDVADLTAIRPEAQVAIGSARVADLSQLNRWLPDSIRLKRGTADANLEARFPAHGDGRGTLNLEIHDLAAALKEGSGSGELSLETTVSGLAEAPWLPKVFDRSHLAAAVNLSGSAHLAASTEARGAARLRFRGNGTLGQPHDWSSTALAQKTSGELAIDGQVYGLADLNRWLQDTPLRVRGGSAAFSATLLAKEGELAEGSKARIDGREIALLAGPFSVTGPLELTGALGPSGPGRLTLRARAPTLTVQSRFLDQTYGELRGDGAQLSVSVRSDTLKPRIALETAAIDAQITGLMVPHLEQLAALVPPLKGLVVSAGDARIDVTLHRDPSGSAQGHLALHAQKLEGSLAEKPVSGDLAIDAHLRGPGDGSIFPHTIDLEGTTLRIEHAVFPRDSDYWAEAVVRQGTLSLSPPGFTADVDVTARDALPVLHLYGKTLGIPDSIDGWLAFQNLKGSATLQVNGDQLSIPHLELHGDALAFQGRIRRTARHTFADFLLKISILTIGVDVRDDKTGVELLGAQGWYEERITHPLPADPPPSSPTLKRH